MQGSTEFLHKHFLSSANFLLFWCFLLVCFLKRALARTQGNTNLISMQTSGLHALKEFLPASAPFYMQLSSCQALPLFCQSFCCFDFFFWGVFWLVLYQEPKAAPNLTSNCNSSSLQVHHSTAEFLHKHVPLFCQSFCCFDFFFWCVFWFVLWQEPKHALAQCSP